MSAVRFAAPIACPSCRRKIIGCWADGQQSAAQQCPACGRIFEAAWPGFTFEPETVIADGGGDE